MLLPQLSYAYWLMHFNNEYFGGVNANISFH